MKPKIHPNYHRVVFIDSSTGDEYVSRSTLTSGEKRQIEGKDHYVVKLEVTAFGHPFYLNTFHDVYGRIPYVRYEQDL